MPPDGEKKGLIARVFGNVAYSRLVGAQFVTSLGDWLGLIAITVLATELGAGNPEASVGVVLAARLIPGFFLAQLAGVIADRLDRRKLMIMCDISRALLLLLLPFVSTVWHLIVISFLMELFTLLWIPAKEALVPSIVPRERFATANSISLIVTYGTFPLASTCLLILAPVAKVLDDVSFLRFLRITDSSIAFYVDSLTFVASALLLYSMIKHMTLKQPKKIKAELNRNIVWHYVVETVKEVRDGLKYIAVTPVVRGVNLGLGTALLGGGMLIPLGAVFARDVLGAGTTGYASLQVALGSGVGAGVVFLFFLKRHKQRITDEHVFVWSCFGAGISLITAATFNVLLGALIAIGFLGVFAGSMYVAGFTILHERVSDNIRGRVFSSLYALMRFCVLASLALGPFLADLIDLVIRSIVGDYVNFGDFTYELPGVRVTLWLAALVIIIAGAIASSGFKFRNGDH